jgi:1-deoxy-D-xylulose-5-phosphate synthase
MPILPSISGPRDLDALSEDQLVELAAEIREFLVENVSRTGGHLGPNLGVVELTIALHRIFSSPDDPFIFDTGHQSYVHKLLTGRQDFSKLRLRGGLAGYPQRSESPHDVVESSHASSSLSWADGVSRALTATGRADRHVVAVLGDGSLTGGMTWEALNNISDDNDRNLVIVVNDNGRSYAPTIGGMSRYLNRVRTAAAYKELHHKSDRLFRAFGPVGRAVFRGVRGGTHGFLSRFTNNEALYSNLDIKYLGPVDGHDLPALLETLELAKSYGAPVIVHAITEKGRGYQPARDDDADQFHAVGRIDPTTGETLSSGGRGWTDVFSDALVDVGERREDVIAMTAAMLRPTGLAPFAERFPDRVYDVGIAEQHAVASAAGLAFGGLHPVVALYATFMGRAFDQVLMDVALHRAGVTFVLDRAGVTGDDGASHNGMWDMSILQVVPGLRLAAPRDGVRVAELLREAVAVTDAPTVLRIPKGPPPAPIEAVDRAGSMDVLVRDGARDVLIVGVGSMAAVGVEVAARLADQGIGVTVVDPRWVKPWDPAVLPLARDHRLVVCVEDNGRVGGCGSTLHQLLNDHQVATPFRQHGIPQEFLDHAKRDAILERIGLTAQSLARGIVEDVTALDSAVEAAADGDGPRAARVAADRMQQPPG